VGLAVAEGIHGQAGLALTAVAAATMIPLLNLLCILAFAGYVASTPVRPWPVLRTVVRNPLILGSLAGMALGLAETGFHPLVAGVLSPLSDLALPLGLMTVGAGLRLKTLRRASGRFAFATLSKLVFFPLLALAITALAGMEGLERVAVVLLAALPAASSSYILARQLGGDAPLMAGIISGQTLLAILTLPLVLLWLGGI